MFFAAGLSAYGAAMFHLFTHAFFKALLFLGAGSVIHAMGDEQDMRKMGGLRPMIPITYVLMVIGTVALTGFPGTAGFFSKDMIIEAAYATPGEVARYAWLAGVGAAFMTSFYSWRLIFMTFHGRSRASEPVYKHVHESPPVMLIPLAALAVGSLLAGIVFAGGFIGEGYDSFWNGALFVLGSNVLESAHRISWMDLTGKWLPTLMMLSGFLIAYVMYVSAPKLPDLMARVFKPIYLFFLNKWYFDELYDLVFVRPALAFGRFLWKVGDGRIIDGLGPDGISALVGKIGAAARKLQTGYIYHYAFAMLIGLAALVTWFLFFRGGV